MRSLAPKFLLVALLLLVGSFPQVVEAQIGCPKIHNLIDFNCDGKIKIVFTGDSIVKGVGDDLIPIEGYPGRLQKAWPWAEIENLGVPGITSARLLHDIKKLLLRRPNGNTSLSVHEADLIVITVGVNDFYSTSTPGGTVSNIVRIVKYLKSKLKSDDGTTPLFLVGTLLHSRRGYQQPFISQVDQLLLRYASSSNLPAYLRFDTIDVYSQSLLNADGLHPLGAGYDRMEQLASKAIKDIVQRLMSKQRSDKDNDGVYDQLEPIFGTNPNVADTDGDGLSDGQEIFACGSDPKKYDSDGDGFPDDCTTPTPTPTPTATPTSTPEAGN